jgi:UDPglucose 6-dehydrogenase
MREAPSLVLINYLLHEGAEVVAYDPQAMEVTREHCLGEKIGYGSDPYEATEGADALVLMTEWNEFRSPKFEILKSKMKGLHIFDGRNIYQRDEVEAAGFGYVGVGC